MIPLRLKAQFATTKKKREQLRALMYLGLADAFRLDNPNLEQYSWWDYRAGGYAKNNGLRIDHLLLSPQATDRLEKSWINETPRGKEKPSDHTPVLATIAI
jgi:exodeoxyribonuclease-3